MKNLNITFEDREFRELEKEKDKSDMSWERFILMLAGVKKNDK